LFLSNYRVFLSPTKFRPDLARGFVCSPNIEKGKESADGYKKISCSTTAD